MKKIILFLLVTISLTTIVKANVSVPNIIGSHMVLQQQAEVSIWGWAEPSDTVSITTSWDQKTYKTKTNNKSFYCKLH